MNPPNTVIESLGIYLPAAAVSTAEIIRNCRKRVLFPLEQYSGIKHRRVAGEQEFSIDLAKRAVENCLAHSRYNPADIDLLICCNISRYDGPNRFSFEPSTSVQLKKHFGFDNALVFDISNACPGMFTAILLVDAFLKTGAARCAMVVSGEHITHLTRTAQKEIRSFMDPRLACLTVGDSGAAMVLEQAEDDSGAGLQEIELYTVGRYCSYCVAKATDQPHGGAIMLTDSINLSAVTLPRAVHHAAQVLERNHWPSDGFQHLIMHQTSIKTLTDAANEINRMYGRKICHDGNVIYNLAERGNTATTSHFVALWDNILNRRINAGDKILFSVTGSGVTVGTALYTLDDLPDRIRRLQSGQGQERKAQAAVPRRAPKPSLPRVRIESLGTTPEWRAGKKNTVDLARIAAEECLETSCHDRSEIGVLIFSGVYRSEFICEPAIAAFLQGALQMNDSAESGDRNRTLALDVFNGAIGFLNAYQIGVKMIQAKKSKAVMIVASEVENNAATSEDSLRGIAETGSAAILDESPDGTGFGSFAVSYVTEHLDALVSYGHHVDGCSRVHIERRADLYEYYLKHTPDVIRKVLALEGLELSQINVIIPPRLPRNGVSILSKAMAVPLHKFVDLGQQDADLFTSSLVFSLQHARQEGLAQPGDIGLSISAGTGIQIGAAIYYF